MASMIPKDRTVAALGEVWASLDDLLEQACPSTSGTLPSPLEGWDVQDNVAHIIGTEEMLSGVPAPAILIDRGARLHVRNDIGEFNEQWIEAIRPMKSAMVLDRFREITGERLAALECDVAG